MKNDGVLCNSRADQIRIPGKEDEMHLLLAIINHKGEAANRGKLSTEKSLKKLVWYTLYEGVRIFVK